MPLIELVLAKTMKNYRYSNYNVLFMVFIVVFTQTCLIRVDEFINQVIILWFLA